MLPIDNNVLISSTVVTPVPPCSTVTTPLILVAVPVQVPIPLPVIFPVTLPTKFAVTVEAEKLPEESLNTTVLFVLVDAVLVSGAVIGKTPYIVWR